MPPAACEAPSLMQHAAVADALADLGVQLRTAYAERQDKSCTLEAFLAGVLDHFLRQGLNFGLLCTVCQQLAEGEGQAALAARYATMASDCAQGKALALQQGIDPDNTHQLYDAYGELSYLRENESATAFDEATRIMLKDLNQIAWWRFNRLLDQSLPLIEAFPRASWLTLGDGRWGFEARYFMRHGCTALPVDIDPRLLLEAKVWGYVPRFGLEHAEHLSFDDNSFDFVCCKDMLHHLCRPHDGLYEAMRVAREGVLFIEPFDHGSLHSTLLNTRPETSWHSFEPEPGNYIFGFSEREVEKMCMCQRFPCVAFKGCNDRYEVAINAMPYYPPDCPDEETPEAHRLRQHLERDDDLCRKGERQWDMLAAILFKRPPSAALRIGLKRAGFALVDLVRNPYLEPACFSALQRKAKDGSDSLVLCNT